jgi:hypothetical protein
MGGDADVVEDDGVAIQTRPERCRAVYVTRGEGKDGAEGRSRWVSAFRWEV